MTAPLSDIERWIVSYYRTSELAGALLFGRLARSVEDPELLVFLTEQFAEEAQHAWLWTKALTDLGVTPLIIQETYQSHYAKKIGIPTSLSEILTLTKVFEERIAEQFTRHARRPDTHPVIRTVLENMLAEEAGHIEWITKRLNDQTRREGADGEKLYRQYKELDETIYQELLSQEPKLQSFFSISVATV